MTKLKDLCGASVSRFGAECGLGHTSRVVPYAIFTDPDQTFGDLGALTIELVRAMCCLSEQAEWRIAYERKNWIVIVSLSFERLDHFSKCIGD